MKPDKIVFKRTRPHIDVRQLISTVIGILLLFVFGVMLTLMLAGCSLIDENTADCSQKESSPWCSPGSAIAFTVADSTTRVATRTAQGTMTLSGAGGTESLREKGFGVFACHTGVHPYISTSSAANLMHNQQVGYDEVNGVWTYSPLVYWPNGNTGNLEYATFFAYAPYSDAKTDAASACIVDFSLPSEIGDPWLIYRLGGEPQADGENGWKARQVDLLYDFRKDQQRGEISTKVEFDFKHALACIGDRITVSCDESVPTRLKGIYTTSPVSLTITDITFDYLLTRKGKLVLNSVGQPNWHPVESEDSKVHRLLTFNPNQVMAQATSSVVATSSSFDSGTGHGIFYIPLEAGSNRQQVTVTADYTVTSGDPTEMIDEGSVSATVDLSFVHNPSEGRDLNITFKIPDPECDGVSLTSAAIGMVVCSHGKAHPATEDALGCGGRKVGILAYMGDASGEPAPYNHGLILAMTDGAPSAWCDQASTVCLSTQVGDLASALAAGDGRSRTAELIAHDSHTHTAAVVARNYRFDGGVRSGAHPVATSQWFLPSMGQWNLMVKSMTGESADLSTSGNEAYKAAGFNSRITAAGGTGLLSGLYWSSTESSASNTWYVSFKDGKTNSTDKNVINNVRPVLAF